MKAPMIELKDVCKVYHKGRQIVSIFERLTLSIGAGEFVAVTGPSGSGKTTLLNMVGAIDRPTSGEIHVAGARLDRMTEGQLADWRAVHVGFIFQSYNLIPLLTAAQNVELPLLLTGRGRRVRAADALDALRLVGLVARAKHFPAELSGGEQQRVAIARAMITRSPLLLCDEPTGDLDRGAADEIMALLRKINDESRATVVLVTHDMGAAVHARRHIHLEKMHPIDTMAAA
jgi:putative ABC transport system ATP-binding protein